MEKRGCSLRRENAVKNSTKTWTQDPTVREPSLREFCPVSSSLVSKPRESLTPFSAVRDQSDLRPYSESDLHALEESDTLLVSKLDRLGRTQSEVVARLASLQQRGVFVRTRDGLLNTASLGKMSPLIAGLLTGLAEVERELN